MNKEAMALLEEIIIAYKEVIEQSEFLTTELLKHRLTEFDKKTISIAKLHKKVLGIEEELDGMRNYLSNSLKRKRDSGLAGKREVYVIK